MRCSLCALVRSWIDGRRSGVDWLRARHSSQTPRKIDLDGVDGEAAPVAARARAGRRTSSEHVADACRSACTRGGGARARRSGRRGRCRCRGRAARPRPAPRGRGPSGTRSSARSSASRPGPARRATRPSGAVSSPWSSRKITWRCGVTRRPCSRNSVVSSSTVFTADHLINNRCQLPLASKSLHGNIAAVGRVRSNSNTRSPRTRKPRTLHRGFRCVRSSVTEASVHLPDFACRRRMSMHAWLFAPRGCQNRRHDRTPPRARDRTVPRSRPRDPPRPRRRRARSRGSTTSRCGSTTPSSSPARIEAEGADLLIVESDCVKGPVLDLPLRRHRLVPRRPHQRRHRRRHRDGHPRAAGAGPQRRRGRRDHGRRCSSR